MMIPAEWDNWAENARGYFERMGASPDISKRLALLWGFASGYGLRPSITSIFRDPKKQEEMQARWDRGDRAGLRTRPATNSKHSHTTWLGKPAALAMDMPTNNDSFTSQIAEYVGLKSGQNFRKPDPGHYYL